MSRHSISRVATGTEPRYRVPGIGLFHPHKYPGSSVTGEPARDYTEADVDAYIAAGNKVQTGSKSFIGHNYPKSDAPERKVRGRFKNFRKEQVTLKDGSVVPAAVADLEDADPLMALNLVRGHYPHVSPEFSVATLETSGVAWLGARKPGLLFKDISLDADKPLVEQIKSDAKDFAIREAPEEDLTALRDDLMSMGGGRAGGDAASVLEQKIERLTGVISEQQKQINMLTAEQASITDLAAIFKGGKPPKSDSKTGETAMADDKKKPEDAVREATELTALREQHAAAMVRIAGLENERVKDAIRSDITALRSKVVIADDTADAIVAACAPVADAKARKTLFDSLTKGLRTIPLEDAAPEANTAIRDGIANGIADEKVRKIYTDALANGKVEKARAVKKEYDSLVAIRARHDEKMWSMMGVGDAVTFVEANI